MNIYKNLIMNYINNKLTVEDIVEYAAKNGTSLSSSESIIIYNFIKRNYKNILDGDESSFIELEQQLDRNLYHKIINLYMNYKSKLLL